MEMKERESGLVVPMDKQEGQPWEDFLFEACYLEDVRRFQKLVEENPRANFVALLRAPFWNRWGQIVGEKYLMVYQAVEAIEMEVMT